MKIRLSDQQIRLRLSPDDMDSLIAGEAARTSIDLGVVGRLEWGLRARSDIERVAISTEGTCITVDIPKQWIPELLNPEQDGLEATVSTNGLGSVALLIQRDLPCRHPVKRVS